MLTSSVGEGVSSVLEYVFTCMRPEVNLWYQKKCEYFIIIYFYIIILKQKYNHS